MNSISESFLRYEKEITLSGARLVAVSKTKPEEDLLVAYQAGCRLFGENKVQEMTRKWEALPKDIEWHFIGHLQSNKVKQMASYVTLIHSVDSEKLLAEINKQAANNNRKIAVLLQVHIAQEETKFGFSADELDELLSKNPISIYENLEFQGLMGMATNTDNEAQIAKEFSHLKSIFDTYQDSQLNTKGSFKELSMGMSGDYKIALAHRSTLIRIGSSIFGSR